MSLKSAFVDSAYFVALSVETDQWHEAAAALLRKTERENLHLVTTWPVLLEVGNSLAKRKFRSAGAALIESILSDPAFTIVPLDDELLHGGLKLFTDRADKEWSLTDCISFLVMRHHGLDEALTSDEHFEQAGFRALLLKK